MTCLCLSNIFENGGRLPKLALEASGSLGPGLSQAAIARTRTRSTTIANVHYV